MDGEPAGLGARPEFDGHPGLWNLFWLHSVKVDVLLDWPLAPEEAPMDTAALGVCIKSAGFSCQGISLEFLCEKLTAENVIERILDNDYHPPIRQFWDETSSGWESFVRDRLKSFKTLKKEKGVVIRGKFPLH